MSSMRSASRPMSSGTRWSWRYDATASSRPFRVASPRPVTPSDVVIFRVTKLRPGEVMMTFASVMVAMGAAPLLCRAADFLRSAGGAAWC